MQESTDIRAKQKLFLTLFSTLFLFSFITDKAQAQVNSELESNKTPGTVEVTAPETGSNYTGVTSQTGVVQFNGNGYSSLGQPNCGGSCFFALTRMSRGESPEVVLGFIWQFKSPENTQAEAQHLLSEIQMYKVKHEFLVNLVEKLAEALESKKMVRANLIALVLAQELGYKDYRVLLEEVTNTPESTILKID